MDFGDIMEADRIALTVGVAEENGSRGDLHAFQRAVSFYGGDAAEGPCMSTPEPETCPGDLNSDGFVTISDVLILLGDFGCTSACVGDVDGDGVVTVADLLGGILASFGEACL